jgi:5-formyltetrahydrofolate cyclo-ligase
VAAGESGGVLVFLPDHREPDIEPVIAGWLDEGRLVAAPRVDWDAGTFRPVRLRSLEDVEVRRHGVREPAGGETVALGALGISLVPGVAFDGFGGRLGRGGGFYDRFLAGLPAGVRRLGVCFAAQVVERIPLERHDERVDAVVTEEGLISVKEGRGGGALDR